MITIVVAIRLWAKFFSHSTVHIYCDNAAVVQVVASHKTRDLFLAACIRNLWLLKAHYDISIQISHIMGSTNSKADLLSRLHSDKPVDMALLNQLRNDYIWDKVLQSHINLDLHI